MTNPIIPEAGKAAAAWIAAQTGGQIGYEAQEAESDIEFDDALRACGVLTDDEAIDEMYESDDYPAVCVITTRGVHLIDAVTGEVSSQIVEA